MPIYEYRCERGHQFEAVQRMTEDALTECQVCGAPVHRLMFAPAVHFKGSGFYNTDYGTAKRKRELDASAKEGADSHDAKAAEKRSGADGGGSSGDSGGSSGDGRGSSGDGRGSSGDGGSGSSADSGSSSSDSSSSSSDSSSSRSSDAKSRSGSDSKSSAARD